MPGENFSRKVARAASVGGGRGYRRQTPLGWYSLIFLICVVGLGLIAYSRYEMNHPSTSSAKANKNLPPNAQNLWKVGLELDICGKMQKLPASASSGPFTTDGTGVVTIEPALAPTPSLAGGKNAVLNAFLVQAGVSLTNNNLTIAPHSPTPSTTTLPPTSTTTPSSSTTASSSTTPSSTTSTSTSSTTSTTLPPAKTYSNGQSCSGKKAVVQTMVWSSPSAKKGTLHTKNAAAIRFKNGQLFTIAFVPKGSSIPKPSSAKVIAQYLIANPGGIATGTTGSATSLPPTASTVPGSTSSISPAPSSTSPAASPTTTKGSSSTGG